MLNGWRSGNRREQAPPIALMLDPVSQSCLVFCFIFDFESQTCRQWQCQLFTRAESAQYGRKQHPLPLPPWCHPEHQKSGTSEKATGCVLKLNHNRVNVTVVTSDTVVSR